MMSVQDRPFCVLRSEERLASVVEMVEGGKKPFNDCTPANSD